MVGVEGYVGVKACRTAPSLKDSRSGDRNRSGDLVRRPLSILAKPGIGQCRAGGWVSEMKPQVWVKAGSKTANAQFDSPHARNTREKKP